MNKTKEISFNEAYKKFQEISRQIEEDEDISIEDQLKKIEEAGKLYKICIKYLNQTKSKIESINKDINEIDI